MTDYMMHFGADYDVNREVEMPEGVYRVARGRRGDEWRMVFTPKGAEKGVYDVKHFNSKRKAVACASERHAEWARENVEAYHAWFKATVESGRNLHFVRWEAPLLPAEALEWAREEMERQTEEARWAYATKKASEEEAGRKWARERLRELYGAARAARAARGEAVRVARMTQLEYDRFRWLEDEFNAFHDYLDGMGWELVWGPEPKNLPNWAPEPNRISRDLLLERV